MGRGGGAVIGLTRQAVCRKPQVFGIQGVAKLNLKGFDGKAPPGVEPAAQFDSTWETSPGPDTERNACVIWTREIELFF